MGKGRECDKCGRHLDDDDFLGYGSWSYNCPSCGFKYRHGSTELDKDDDIIHTKKEALESGMKIYNLDGIEYYTQEVRENGRDMVEVWSQRKWDAGKKYGKLYTKEAFIKKFIHGTTVKTHTRKGKRVKSYRRRARR